MRRVCGVFKRMAGTLLCLAAVSALSGLSGCRCCPASNCYYDKIDDISDHEACLDHLYNPRLDISRAGMPDWCQGKWNRKICPCRCCGTCCQHKQPMYPATYRMRYQQFLAQQEAQKRDRQLDELVNPAPPQP